MHQVCLKIQKASLPCVVACSVVIHFESFQISMVPSSCCLTLSFLLNAGTPQKRYVWSYCAIKTTLLVAISLLKMARPTKVTNSLLSVHAHVNASTCLVLNIMWKWQFPYESWASALKKRSTVLTHNFYLLRTQSDITLTKLDDAISGFSLWWRFKYSLYYFGIIAV